MYKNNHVEFNKRLHDNILYTRKQQNLLQFVPRCMECRRGLAMRILSVYLSVCLSNAWIVTKWKKHMSRYLYHTKEHLAYFLRRKWLVEATPSTWNFGSTGPRWSEIADFQPIFARSASAVTPSEKCSINTNRKSTARFPMSLRSTSCVVSMPPKGAQKRNVSKIWTISCDNSETIRDRCQ